MSFGGGTTSDVGDPRSGEATYGGTRSTAGAASDMGITVGALEDIMSGGDGGDGGGDVAQQRRALDVAQQKAIADLQVATRQAQEMKDARALLAGVKDLEQRQAADAIMGMPAYMNAISQFNLGNIAKQISQGGRPVYNNAGQIMGVMGKGLFGGTVYSGRPDFDPNRTEEGGDQPDRPRYPYPMSAEEEEEEREATQDEIDKEFQMEYIRPIGGFYPETGAYARMGLLDTMPDGLLEFMPDFARQNRAFRMQSATRPEYFQDPYNLRGYSLLS